MEGSLSPCKLNLLLLLAVFLLLAPVPIEARHLQVTPPLLMLPSDGDGDSVVAVSPPPGCGGGGDVGRPGKYVPSSPYSPRGPTPMLACAGAGGDDNDDGVAVAALRRWPSSSSSRVDAGDHPVEPLSDVDDGVSRDDRRRAPPSPKGNPSPVPRLQADDQAPGLLRVIRDAVIQYMMGELGA
uniref:Uncharacterized protein n=1 Tax=Leersia perrieri TaxID=77586 RepID=A0A0D9WJB7_9ORYZ